MKEQGVVERDNLIAYKRTLNDLEVEYEDFIAAIKSKSPHLVLSRLISNHVNTSGLHIVDSLPSKVVGHAEGLLLEEIPSITEDDLAYFLSKYTMLIFLSANGSRLARKRLRDAAQEVADTLLS